jgi:rare lipoprotein A
MAVCALALVAGASPAHAADSGGASYQDTDVTLVTKPNGYVGRKKRFTGTAPAGAVVTVERYDDLERQWAPITHATADDEGAFTARWKVDRAGGARVRARADGARTASVDDAPEVAITLFEPATATWYGPGFYGRKTACGKTMSKTLVGVAHKSLPCGTKVTFLYKGTTVTAPVVDRGPYAKGVKWDLTAAAAQQLGFEATDTVGALQADSR